MHTDESGSIFESLDLYSLAEVQKQADGDAGGSQIVQALSSVNVIQSTSCFQFNQYLSFHD
jgi:hypothetical protein